MKKTKQKIYILDLAVPRDIDPEIGKLPNVNLYDIEIIENHSNIYQTEVSLNF